MENSQDDDAFALNTVFEHVSGIENLQHDLSIFGTTFYRPPEERALGQDRAFSMIASATIRASQGCCC